jgi:hypothetical protein
MKGNIQVCSSDFDTKPAARKWPFSEMAIGEVVGYDRIDDPLQAQKAQTYCHTYGKSCGKKFETKSIAKDGRPILLIKRIS